MLGERHPDTIRRLINLGGARRVLGETEGPEHLHAALEAHRLAERQAQELQPPALDLVALAANNQGLDLLGLHQPQAALEPLTRALELRRRLADGQLDLDALQSLVNIAKALLEAGQPREPERRYQQVLNACDSMNLPLRDNRRSLSWDGLGEVAFRAGDYTQAAEFFDRSYQAFAALLTSRHVAARNHACKMIGRTRTRSRSYAGALSPHNVVNVAKLAVFPQGAADHTPRRSAIFARPRLSASCASTCPARRSNPVRCGS